MSTETRSDLAPRFGEFGGRYVPEVLVAAHEELEAAYAAARRDPAFGEELADLGVTTWGGRRRCTWPRGLRRKWAARGSG